MMDRKIYNSIKDRPDLLCRTIDSPLGPLFLLAGSAALHAVNYGHPGPEISESIRMGNNEILEKTAVVLHGCFSGVLKSPAKIFLLRNGRKAATRTVVMSPAADKGSKAIELSLEMNGVSENELKVYRELLGVPWGRTVTYGELALMSGFPRGARFVGNAMGKNPFPLLIPCHRVTAANGKIGGYTSGIDKKLWLLEWEKGRDRT